jgi:YVTN family beta-propeller protein
MDDDRVDALFARYVERLVVDGVGPGVDDLAGGDPGLAAALAERIAAFRVLDEHLGRTAASLTGQLVGHFRVFERIGAGGMGEVYRAEDTRLGREVALKTLPPLFSLDPQRRARFEREARLLAALDHPGVAAIYGIERAAKASFLVLELVRGETMAERLARAPLPFRRALPLLRDVALALEAAHARGIVHRDLKPANVKLTLEGTAKVLDFGLGKELGVVEGEPLASAAGPGTVSGMVLGTPAYMSPEQARGQEVDARTDVWSFGCLAYEALAGRPAFAGESFPDVVAAVVGQEPDWAALPAATPASIRALLRRCLAKGREERLATMSEVRSIVEGALAPPGRGGRWVGPAVSAALLAVGLGTAALLAARNQEPTPPGPGAGLVPPSVVRSVPPTDAGAYRGYLRTAFLRWQAGLGEPRPRTSAVYMATGEPPQLWVMDGSSGAITSRAPLPFRGYRRYFGPFVTPDGTRSYLSLWGPTARVVPIDNATRTVLPVRGRDGIAVGRDPGIMAFTPDGKRAYVATLSGLLVVDTDAASPTFHTVLRVPEGDAIAVGRRPFGVAVTADGARAYVANQGSDTVSVVDTDAASPRFHTVLPVPDGRAIRVGLGPRGLALDPARARLYVANTRSNDVSVVDTDPRSPTVHATLSTVALATGLSECFPYSVTVSPDGTRLYVPCVSVKQVVVIDAASLAVAARIPGFGMRVFLSSDGRRGFVLLPESVTVIDTDPTSATFHQVLETLPTAFR